MKKQWWFYNYNAAKTGSYDKFNHGTLSSDNESGGEVYEHVVKMARKKYPDADNINITSLNRI